MGCAQSLFNTDSNKGLPTEEAFFVDQPSVIDTFVPGVKAAGILLPTTEGYVTNEGQGVGLKLPGWHSGLQGTAYKFVTPGSLEVVVTSEAETPSAATALFTIASRASLFTSDFDKLQRSDKTHQNDLDKRVQKDLEAEAPSLVRDASGALVGVLKSHDKYKKMRFNGEKSVPRSYVLYSVAPRFTGQAAVALEGVDAAELYPWANISIKVNPSSFNPLAGRPIEVFLAAKEGGFETQSVLTLKEYDNSAYDEKAVPGKPKPFTGVSGAAKQGAVIASAMEDRDKKRVWWAIRVAKGVDASLVAVAKTTESLLRDRVAFELSEKAAFGAWAGR